MELGPFYLHALFYLGRVGNLIKPNWMALQFHFRRILLAVIAAIVLECDAIWLHCYLPNTLLKRDCSIRVRIERENFCETKFKSSIYIQQLPPWDISRAIFYIEPLFPGAFKTLFSFPFWSCWFYVKSVYLFIYLFVFTVYKCFLLSTSLMDFSWKLPSWMLSKNMYAFT